VEDFDPFADTGSPDWLTQSTPVQSDAPASAPSAPSYSSGVDTEIMSPFDDGSAPSWLRQAKQSAPDNDGGDDFGRAVVSGAYGTLANLGGAAEYIVGEGGVSTAIKEFGRRKSDETIAGMSERGRRELGATFIRQEGKDNVFDADISSFRALALKAGSSLPSLVASVFPAGAATRLAQVVGATRTGAAAVGTGVGGVVGGAMTGGATYEDIQSDLRKVPDAKLQEQNDLYYYLRSNGLSEKDARKDLETFIIGAKPLVMAGITALTSRFGVEGLVAKGVAGTGAKGVLRNIGRGAVGLRIARHGGPRARIVGLPAVGRAARDRNDEEREQGYE
jgi:hypothetical protein